MFGLIVFYTGSVGYLVKQFNRGDTFADTLLSLGMLVSATFCTCNVYIAKQTEKKILHAVALIDTDVYIALLRKKFNDLIDSENYLQRFFILYTGSVSVIAFIIIELQNCDVNSEDTCGYIVPSVRINKHKLLYLMTAFLLVLLY